MSRFNSESYSKIKGRGAQKNVHNRFFELSHEQRDDFLNYCAIEGEQPDQNKTEYLKVFPKTIVNKVKSPDVGMAYSMNMYQGCEHGCVYCYARNSHEFWGYGAGLDFERKILVKADAPKLLEAFIKRKSWQAHPIVMSGNTDCYQPAEKKLEITRACLEIFLKYKHPASIITKNALILRDLDLLKALAKDHLISVNMSITSLSEDTRRIMEPRTASIKKRFEAVNLLSEHGIPVNVMMAPIIPSINSHEILALAKLASEAGASKFSHSIVRLNGAIGQIFADWLHKSLPDRAEKVLHQIEDCHGGTLSDSRLGTRMRGEGQIAKQINDLGKLARLKYFKHKSMPCLNVDLHESYKDGQLRLF
ncbi:PA0069 family radical SAM protein [Subsaximicrobium wynnwilliamsii]|uniref:PA0069 family radical SAM protein n=1 Tax=Subsaximicrobium wynnwilliamsii TaxID=291179 RepID=A0A5C6ZJJ0_9FLAO|nr:PA0069 family radical SAM protein [Subsaximicrobium wynnwilliamsii]TXD83989.1 PA0069 family radical SAM protein [Subsaximicrobium wynnwilliamsii]TXD89729.1 PA0069 family radical SAM protein [Subsaximicrobium wynnwilliamsii]TXE02659.1 PA0069 family radical SAM protein [Subsaximicrobium wynnwilliamsii]